MDDWAPIFGTPESDSPITEKFDPTWPFNFKWGYNVDTGEAHVWRVKGGTDGRPSHRKEFAQFFGREPRVQHGDVMGLATYMPAERKLDGTVVAPPTVLLQAYYGQDIPQSVFDYFEQVFPDAVPRRAKIAMGGDTFDDWAPDIDSGEEEVIKWVWNREWGTLIWQADERGLPTHEMKIESEWDRHRNPKDFFGYAVPVGATLEMETYSAGTPLLGVQTIKQKLAELYPDKDILLPPEFESGHDLEFKSDPATYSRRTAAAKWAAEHLSTPSEMPLEAPGSHAEGTERETRTPQPGFLSRAFQRLRSLGAKKADMEGAMVAIFIPKEVGEKIKVKGGEPVENMHITLAYFAEKADERDDWDEVVRIVEQIAKKHPPLSGKIGGVGIFQNDEAENVLWASPNIPGLAELRDDIVEAIKDAGIPLSDTHGWTPHITLKYEFEGKPPHLVNYDLTLDTLTFARGENQEHFKFEGGFEKHAVEDYLSWPGWKGPYKFATDGKEIVKEPVEDHRDAFGLGDELRRRYPETKQIVEGVAVPTADEMGYGIYAPTLGWGAPDQPEIHTVISLLDRELGKPTHLVDEPFNAEHYRVGVPG